MLNGAFTFFMYVDIYNLVKDTLLPQIKHFKTHPSPIDRIFTLRKKFNKKVGYSKKEIEGSLKYCEHIKEQLKEVLAYYPERFDDKGSLYLSKHKTKYLVDRIDY